MMERIQRILILILKEFQIILLDRKSRIVVIVPPILQFFIFSYAATFDLNNARFAVLDDSNTVLSRQFIDTFREAKQFSLLHQLESAEEIAPLITKQQVKLVLHIPSDFSQKIYAGVPVSVQAITDGRNANVATTTLGYVQSITNKYTQSLADASMAAAPPVTVVNRAWFNENFDSRWYIVSALGGIISMVIVMILSSLSISREREFGTFDQLLVSPLRSHEILIGKAVPCLFFGLADALVLAAATVYWFSIPFRGTIPALLVTLLVFMLAIVGVGLFISSISVTMQQGLLGSFVFIMPSVLLGGFTTPIENMPQWLQWITYCNPLRYVVKALREIFLVGADTIAVWPYIWPLLLITCITMPAATVMFRIRTN
ncbi:MAG: ABC transporter permease [Desulfovibrionales bacterium]|nr:ABC transporter permease [Desulfovibrionales bacterium]